MRRQALTLILILLFSSGAAASEGIQHYSYVFKGRTITVPIGERDGVRVNDRCLSAHESCEALRRFHRAASVHWSKNPDNAGDHCVQNEGTQLLLTSPDQRTSLFCVFQDLSMIDARALLSQHESRSGR